MNPFEVFDLDPSLGLSEITNQLRDRMENARSDDEREALRKAWEVLTLVPHDRFRFALSTPPMIAAQVAPPLVEEPVPAFGLDSLNQLDFINLCD
jgi:hypothetical protein